MSARDLYNSTIRQLPAVERLRLASYILDDLAAANVAGLDIKDEWSAEDMADLTVFSMKHSESSVPTGDADA